MNDKGLVKTLLAQLSEDQGVPTEQLVKTLPEYMNPNALLNAPNKPVQVNRAMLDLPQPEIDEMIRYLNDEGISFGDLAELEEIAPRIDPIANPELAKWANIPEEVTYSGLSPDSMARLLAKGTSTGGLTPQQRHIMRQITQSGRTGTNFWGLTPDDELMNMRSMPSVGKTPFDYIREAGTLPSVPADMVGSEALADRGFKSLTDRKAQIADMLRQLGITQ